MAPPNRSNASAHAGACESDAERSEAANEATILRDLAWMGLDWDEGPDVGGAHGPYRQSERTERYRELAHRLVGSGHAYPSFESAEEIAEANNTDAAKVYAEFQKAGRIEAMERELTEKAVFDFLIEQSEITEAPSA